MPRVILITAAGLICFGMVALGQPAVQLDKKVAAGKGKDDASTSKGKDPEKTKPPEKTIEPIKEIPKAKVPLDKMKFPKDAIIVVVDDLLNAQSLFPKLTFVSLEEWLAQKGRIKALEDQLKADRKAPSWCKLFGRLEGEFLVFRAEYSFSTEQPRSTVVLGLQGGHLTEEGDLDRQIANLDYDKEDGFVVRVEKDGSHQLTLHFRVPVYTKKASAGAMEREIDLGLPGAAGTVLYLDLPSAVKELRWNKTLEKAKTPGRWQLGLGTGKALNLAWKEPLALAGNAPLAKAEGRIKVDIDATHINVNAEMFLEDSRLQTTKWHLLLPPLAKIDEVQGPAGLTAEVIPPEKGKLHYTLETSGATAERWQVKVSLRVPRPDPGVRVAVGPFYVLGAFQQTGTITVTNPAEFSFGQRLIPTRNGEVYQQTNTETEAVFRYVAPPVSVTNFKGIQALKALLELEWRSEKSQLETHVAHDLKLQTGQHGWEISATTHIHAKALFAPIHAVELKFPVLKPRGIALIGTVGPGLEFPGGLPWAGIWEPFGMPWTYSEPDAVTVLDEQGAALKVIPQDATGKARVILSNPVKEAKLVVKNVIRIPTLNRRIRMELPRPLNSQDRGAKLTIQTDQHIELMHGPAGAEEPVPGRDHFDLSWDQAPSVVDLAWRPHHREITAHSTLDLLLHKTTAEVIQSLQLPKGALVPKPNTKTVQVALRVPDGADVRVLAGWERISFDPARNTLWVRPEGPDIDRAGAITLHYDVAIAEGQLEVLPIRPVDSSHQDVKVRVWSTASVRPRLAEDGPHRRLWKERSIEAVKGKSVFPSLVLHGFGEPLPLKLKVEDTLATPSSAFVAGRALIRVRTLDDGSQQCRALYLIQRIHAPHVDLELPVPASLMKEGPTVSLGKQKLERPEKLDAAERAVRIKLHPELVALPAVLEISYTIPADKLERNNFFQTTLYAPTFRSDVLIGQMRWQLTTGTPMLATSFGRHARPDFILSLQTWLLTPETPSNVADLEAWANATEATPVAYSFAEVSPYPVTVYHLPRTWWLLGCSGLFLIVTLGAYLLELNRWVSWLLLVALAAGVLTLAMLCPAAMPPILFGLQPGIVLFLLFAAGHWLMSERSRRQIVLATGFSRTKPGSTMVRSSAAKRPREPSTVDNPEIPPEDATDKPTTASG